MKGFVNLHLFSYSIQERVMKITAMAGLVQLSLHILDSMLCIRPRVYSATSADDDDDVSAGIDSREKKPHIPSSMSYIAVLTGLRRVKKLYVLEQTLSNLSNACQELHVQTEGAQDYYIENFNIQPPINASINKQEILKVPTIQERPHKQTGFLQRIPLLKSAVNIVEQTNAFANNAKTLFKLLENND